MPQEQKSILLFEDDFESMHDLKEHLEETMGWHVELTADRGLPERLGQERFDLVIVDAMIRPTSLDAEGKEVENVHFDNTRWLETGIEFLRRLRKGEFSQEGDTGTSPNVPVIILSAAATHSVERELGDHLTVEGYAEKPFRLEDMVERIRKLLQELP